jgi:hypothetical protein
VSISKAFKLTLATGADSWMIGGLYKVNSERRSKRKRKLLSPLFTHNPKIVGVFPHHSKDPGNTILFPKWAIWLRYGWDRWNSLSHLSIPTSLAYTICDDLGPQWLHAKCMGTSWVFFLQHEHSMVLEEQTQDSLTSVYDI